jgi:polyhydroxybutyrate depolymerase
MAILMEPGVFKQPTPHLISCALLALLVLAAGCDDGPEGEVQTGRLDSGGLTRSYVIHTPPGYEAGRAVPLVLVFHGSPGSGESMRQFSELDGLGDDTGWLVAYPDATADWAEGCNGCARADRDGVDDVQFVSDLIDTLAVRFAVDTDRVYALGYSQGGLFAHRLACDLTHRIAATAAVSAPMSTPLSGNCEPDGTMPMLLMHGENDPVFPWVGMANGNFSTLSLENTAIKWAASNGCAAGTSINNDPPGTGDAGVQLKTYTNCPPRGEVRLYRLNNFGHDWPRKFDMGRLMADFFKGYSNGQ